MGLKPIQEGKLMPALIQWQPYTPYLLQLFP